MDLRAGMCISPLQKYRKNTEKEGIIMNSVKEKFKNMLIESGVEEACKKMNFDFEDIFLKASKEKINRYKDYTWYVRPHSMVEQAIHAIPLLSKSDTLPWEEWFVLEGKKIHNILFTEKKDKFEGEFEGKLDDKDHPKEVLGKKWYYFFDTDFEPYMF